VSRGDRSAAAAAEKGPTHPELIKLRLLVVIGTLVLPSAAKLVAAANINGATAGSLVLGLHTNQASVDLFFRVRVYPFHLHMRKVQGG